MGLLAGFHELGANVCYAHIAGQLGKETPDDTISSIDILV
jgi:hypothetical protein